MKKTSKKQWFATVSTIAYMWDRKSANEIQVLFQGYKCENYFKGSEALQALGGLVLSAEFDRHSGCTYCTVREPKNFSK